MFRIALPFAFIAFAVHAQTTAVPPALATIKQKLLDDVRRAPDYTCSELIERKSRTAGSKSYDLLDRVRVEVSYVSGKELFAWRGGDPIAADELPRLVLGTVSNGDFAMHPRVLLTNSRVQFSEPAEANDPSSRRFHFRVPASSSDWQLSVGGRDTQTAYHGFLDVVKDSGRLARIELMADALPAALGYTSIVKRLEYADVRIGNSAALLPSSSELVTVAADGQEIHSETHFADFRNPSPPVAPSAGAGSELPDEINIELTLETPVDSDTSAVGDPIAARVHQTIKKKKDVVVPKGALLYGRISVLEMVQGFRIVDFVFTHFDVDGRIVDLRNRSNMLELEDRYTMGDKVLVNEKMGPMSGKNVSTVFTRAPGPIRMTTPRAKVPKGFKLYLRSTPRAAN